MNDKSAARPRAFRLDGGRAVVIEEGQRGASPLIEEQPDHYEREALEAANGPSSEEAAIETAQKRGMAARALFSWGGLFWTSLTSLIGLAFTMWATQFIEGLFARTPALGYVGLTLAGLAALALLALFIREMRGISRQRHIARLHIDIAKAREADDRTAARNHMRDLVSLYGARSDTARARAHVEDLTAEIVDGRDLIDIAERELMLPLDQRVSYEIAAAAKRVSVVTAISPRAIVDLLFVAAQSVRLVRSIAEIYGGRPSSLGFLRILKSVGAHLAITGGMAVGDSIVQQMVGHGLAARLSARLGEGFLNGMLTARVGLSAMAVCRPMPFEVAKAPGLTDVAPFLFSKEKDEA
ncbi:MAG: YcjF family protein [Beijerinckiaceae bacterium]|nr:YcjF family protein [Beijerinckiaceae bacterium]